MLQAFHKYQKSVLLIFLALGICAAMLLFGLNPYGGSVSNAYALKINGEEVSQNDFYNAKRNLENNYRQRFGDMYEQLIKFANIDITQQTVDQIISRTLLTQFAKNQDLAVSPNAIKEYVFNFFGENFSVEAYQAYLQNTGQTAESFEASLGQNLLPDELSKIIKSHVNVSDFEIRNSLKNAETKYSYTSIVFDPEKYKAEINDPEAEILQTYYEENAAQYEVPEKVKYSYVALNPEDNLDLVEILPEDIELFYEDHLSKYSTPEEVKVQQVVISFDASKTEDQINAKNKADQVLEEVDAGKSFEEALKQANLKLEAAKWTKKTENSPAFNDAAFNLEAMGSVKLVTEANRYVLLQAQDFKESEAKPLEDVKDEIVKSLQRKDVPAYVLIKGQDLFDEWQNSEQSLEALAQKHNLTLVNHGLAFAATEDPTDNMVDLSRLVLSNKSNSKQFHEVGNYAVLVEVKEIIDSKTPELETIKEELVEAWKKEQLIVHTQNKANNFLEQAKQAESSLDKLIAEYAAESDEKKDLLPNARDEELLNEELRNAVFKSKTTGLTETSYLHNGKVYLVNIQSITPPSDEAIDAKLSDEREKLINKNYEILLATLVSKLKAEAEIEIASSFI